MNPENKNTKQKKRINGIFLMVLFVLAVLCTVAIRVYYEYLLYLDIGYKYTVIFFTNLQARVISMAISFLAVFAVIFANNMVLRKIAYKSNDDWYVIKKPIYTVLFSLFMSLFASAFISAGTYENVLSFMNAVSVGETDPLFGKDIGYYMFTRPFFMNVTDSVKCIFLLNLICTFVIYLILWMRNGIGGIKNMFENKNVTVHIIVNIMLLIVSVAVGYKFSIEELMYKSFASVTGAGAAHLKIWYPYYRVAPFMLIIIVPLCIYFLTKRCYRYAAWTIASFPLIWFCTVVCAVTYQSMFVDSNELANESVYLGYNIEMTKKAYGLNNIQRQTTEEYVPISERDLDAVKKISDNMDISDASIMLDVYNSEQAIDSNYKFYEVDRVPYIINGERKTLSVSAREISDENKSMLSYAGNKFRNTFGSGMVMTSSSTEKGKYYIYDNPPVSDINIANISESKIYYGENENSTVIANTDYDNDNYIGIGGVQMTPLNRIVIGICSGDYGMITNTGISPKSRAIMNRNIKQRVKKIAPFFEYDSDPYIIVDDNGVMKWVMDAYSVSDKYPYSQKTGDINYISPCAKVIIDAYSGIVDFYITDTKEPMMRMYRNIYPYVFSENDIPESIKNYIRYPMDIFKIQSDIYKRYYVDDIKSFYSENLNMKSLKTKENGGNDVEPWYAISNGKIVLTVPYTYDGENVCAYMEASCEAGLYGMMSLTMVGGGGFEGIAKVQNAINSSTEVTKYIHSLEVNGGTVRQGNICMIPINQSVIYAAPLYVTGELGENKTFVSDIIVYADGKTAVFSDIETAIRVIISRINKEYKNDFSVYNTSSEFNEEEVINDIIKLYNRIKEYQRVSDWENYGRAMKEFDTKMMLLEETRGRQKYETEFVGPQKTE